MIKNSKLLQIKLKKYLS